MLAFLLSLILVAVNIGQIITMIVPLINAHATPDSISSSKFNNRLMKCGVGAEATAVSSIFGVFSNSLEPTGYY